VNAISKARIETVVSRGEDIWVIVLDGDPVRIIDRVAYSDGQRVYWMTTYMSRGSAERTCRKPNQQFAGNKFSVKQLL
jgi:hypothetical protein